MPYIVLSSPVTRSPRGVQDMGSSLYTSALNVHVSQASRTVEMAKEISFLFLAADSNAQTFGLAGEAII